MTKFRKILLSVPQIESNKLINPSLYITKIGNFLRRYSLDELPQLFLVLFGIMTLVGPRPALYNQLDLIKKRTEFGINKLKPGITGLAQVNGRDFLTLDRKIKFDLEYLHKRNFFFDIKIILKTFIIVSGKTGIRH